MSRSAREDVSAVQTSGLTKDYGSGRGLFDLDLQVIKGEVFGFLGPNGAGKTTTIRLLMGMIFPARGSASVFGLDCWKDAVEIKKKVGYTPGELPQFGGLRGSEIVSYVGGLRGALKQERVRNLCRRLGLDLSRKFREYSRGNKQKLALVLAFMHEPELLVLDEPTGGLDPLNQQTFYELLREARERGATVFLSSHVLSEVEHVCDRVGIIREGKLVTIAELDEIRRLRIHHVEVELAGTADVERLKRVPGIEQLKVDGNRIHCNVRGSFEPFLEALQGQQVLNLVSQEPTLEEIFLTYYRTSPESPASP